MAIVGITQDKDGAPIIRQAVTHKLVIGRGPGSAGNPGNAPKKLDHIAFMRKNGDGKWVDDSELTDYYKTESSGQPTRSVEIVLFDNDIEKVFHSSYMAYVKRGCWCKGDGETAERRNPLGKDTSKEWGDFKPFTGPCANGGCSFPEQKKCKPMGTLQFSLMHHLKLGSVCKVQTTGKQSIAQIYSALETLRRMTGGVIKGIPIKLFVQPDRAVYVEAGQAKTGSKFVWGLEVNARDFQELRRQLTSGPREFYQILQLGSGTVIETDEEDEEDVAGEVTDEFGYDREAEGDSADNQGHTGTPPEQTALDESDLESKADALMTMMGMGNRAYRDAQIGKNRGRMKEFVADLEKRRNAAHKGRESSQAGDPKTQEKPSDEKSQSAKARVRQRQEEKNKEREIANAGRNEPDEEASISDEDLPSNTAASKQQPQTGFDF